MIASDSDARSPTPNSIILDEMDPRLWHNNVNNSRSKKAVVGHWIVMLFMEVLAIRRSVGKLA